MNKCCGSASFKNVLVYTSVIASCSVEEDTFCPFRGLRATNTPSWAVIHICEPIMHPCGPIILIHPCAPLVYPSGLNTPTPKGHLCPTPENQLDRRKATWIAGQPTWSGPTPVCMSCALRNKTSAGRSGPSQPSWNPDYLETPRASSLGAVCACP